MIGGVVSPCFFEGPHAAAWRPGLLRGGGFRLELIGPSLGYRVEGLGFSAP